MHAFTHTSTDSYCCRITSAWQARTDYLGFAAVEDSKTIQDKFKKVCSHESGLLSTYCSTGDPRSNIPVVRSLQHQHQAALSEPHPMATSTAASLPSKQHLSLRVMRDLPPTAFRKSHLTMRRQVILPSFTLMLGMFPSFTVPERFQWLLAEQQTALSSACWSMAGVGTT